ILIGVYDLTYCMDQLNDKFGHMVAGSCFASKYECSWCDCQTGIFFDPVIEVNDVKNIKLLTFVFMNPFHHDVEHGGGIYTDSCYGADLIGKCLFITPFDSLPFFPETGIF